MTERVQELEDAVRGLPWDDIMNGGRHDENHPFPESVEKRLGRKAEGIDPFLTLRDVLRKRG